MAQDTGVRRSRPFILSHLSHLVSKARHRYNDIMGLDRHAQHFMYYLYGNFPANEPTVSLPPIRTLGRVNMLFVD